MDASVTEALLQQQLTMVQIDAWELEANNVRQHSSLTVTDNNNNVSTCTATVTVEDNVAPVATCQDVTVQLDASGNGSTTATAVDNGSSDACGIASQTDFVCSDWRQYSYFNGNR
ncbi:MAG: hypothetical protein R2753_02035 [Chitinophagales bacterium]